MIEIHHDALADVPLVPAGRFTRVHAQGLPYGQLHSTSLLQGNSAAQNDIPIFVPKSQVFKGDHIRLLQALLQGCRVGLVRKRAVEAVYLQRIKPAAVVLARYPVFKFGNTWGLLTQVL